MQQILEMNVKGMFMENIRDTIAVNGKWRTKISKLKDLQDIAVKLRYTDSSGQNKELMLPVTDLNIYRDWPNAPDKILHYPLHNTTGKYCDLFTEPIGDLDTNEFIILAFRNKFYAGKFPDTFEIEITLFWQDGKNSSVIRFGKGYNISDGVSNRPFG